MGRKFQPPSKPVPPETYGDHRLTVDRRTDCSVVCKWTLTNLDSIKSKAVYGPYFEVRGGVDCRLVLYPRGDTSALPGSLSLYLQVIDSRGSTKFDCFTHYKLSIINNLDQSKSLHRDSFYRFTSKKKLHGWCDFSLYSTVLDPKLGFVSNNSLIVTADIRVLNESTSFVPENGESKSASSSLSVSSGKFTWTVKNFGLFRAMIKTHKLMSPSFPAEDCDLRIAIYRSVVEKVEYLSLCLESREEVGYSQMEKFNSIMYRTCWCMFRMSVLNHESGSKSVHRDSHGRFGINTSFGDNTYIGWTNFMKMSRFVGPENSFLVDDTAVFSVSFQAIKESNGCVKVARTPASRNTVLPTEPDWYNGGHVWKIKNFTRLKDHLKKRKIMGLAIKSRTFQVGNQEFRLVIYPRGESQPPCHLSFYLEVMEKRNISSDWSCFVSYRLSITNQKTLNKSICKASMARSSNDIKELGWCEFASLNSIFDLDSGFIVGDTIYFCAEVLLLQEKFLKGNAELRNAGFPVDLSGEGEVFLWMMDNFLSFKGILKTKKIASQTFQVGECELRIGVCKSLDSICAYLECDPSVMSDPDKSFWVSYRMALVNQKNFSKSVWKEFSFCTKSRINTGIQFVKVSDMLDPDAGFLVRESVAFLCQIIDHCPWFDFSEPGVSASDDSQSAFSNDPDEFGRSKCSEISSEHEDDIFESILKRADLEVATQGDCCLMPNVTKRIWMDADWMCSTMNKLRIYLSETITAKDLLSAVDNLVNCDVKRHIEFSPFLTNLWTLVKISQQVIIDLLLDIVVECSEHSKTRSSEYCYNASSKPCARGNGVASLAEFSTQIGTENSCQSSKYETLAPQVDGTSTMCSVDCLGKWITDILEADMLVQPPLETSVAALLKISSVQELKIKWPEQSEELLDMIINSLKALDVTVPQSCSNPKPWPVSVQKISHVLDRAPKYLQLDLVMLVPKLVDHSEHPLAACALVHQLKKSDAEPELQIRVFAAINQLDIDNEVWERLFFVTSELVVELNDEALATTIGFLFQAASHCQLISEAVCTRNNRVRVVRARLFSLGVEVSSCVLNFLSETINSCSDISKALLRDIDFNCEFEDKHLASSGRPLLYGKDELLSTSLNVMNDELLHKDHHFSDVYMLVEMLSVPSLATEASQALERAVARSSIVVHLVAMVLERKRALSLNIVPISFVVQNQLREEAVDQKIKSSVEKDDFASLLGLAEMFSLSRDSKVQQFAQMFYATLFRLFGDENYYKIMLKQLVDRAISHRENGHQEDTDFKTLLFLINEEQELAGSVLNMMRDVAKVTKVDCATLRHQLRASEDHNLRTEEEKRVALADMVREKTSLLERLSESEVTTNHYKSELKREKDRFAREKKELSNQIQEVESQLEWFRSEQNDEMTKLSIENKAFKECIHNLETQLTQLKSWNNQKSKKLVKEKNALAEKLKSSEAARKRSVEELKCYAKEIQILEDVKHSLEDEVRQLKVTIGQLEQEKLDREEKNKQCETLIGGMEANIRACQQYIHSLEVNLKDEMSQHAPLYGVGLEDLSVQELETLSLIHQEGLEQIYALQQQKSSLATNPPVDPIASPNSSRSYFVSPSPIPVRQPALVSLHGNLAENSGRVAHTGLS